MWKRVRDTDEKTMRRRKMRLRFKRLVQTVMSNQQMLDETEEQAGISMNVKKNVALLVRQKRKAGLLTVVEKALLRSKHSYRTIEERRRLCMILANMPCFSKLPPKIRARLVPIIKYSTFNADHMIIKEGDLPIYVYFVVSGEIEMMKKTYDKVTKRIITTSEAIIGAGDWIGMVEFLEDCPRLNTFVTLKYCEILSITDDEFHKVMGPFVKKDWQDKKSALKSLSYFDFLNEDQIVRACNYSVLVQYDPLQSIYSEDRGAISCVHFILSGECVILQCLKMRTMKKNGIMSYELSQADPTQSNLFDNITKSSRSLSTIFKDVQPQSKLLSDSYFILDELLDSLSDTDEETLQKKKALRKMGLREIEIACGLRKPISLTQNRTMSMRFIKKHKTIRSKSKTQSVSIATNLLEERTEDNEEELFLDADLYDYDYVDEEYLEEEMVSEIDYEIDDKSDEKSLRSSLVFGGSVPPFRRTSAKHNSSRKASTKTTSTKRSVKEKLSLKPKKVIPPSVYLDGKEDTKSSESSSSAVIDNPILPVSETHFIDVGSVSYGGIFGLGEKMAHRVIMARTVVQCLLLPRFWLMEEDQNPGHIWQRRRFYLEGGIPSREELFGNFLKTRRWEKFKRDYVRSTLNPNSVNSTQPEDIPIISRIVQTDDDI